jgi:uncharacterized protein YndB with AHSA1/START domain
VISLPVCIFFFPFLYLKDHVSEVVKLNTSRTSILINKDVETVWNAIANDEHFSNWYAPGSKWNIPIFEVGEQATFTLMPSSYNDLKKDESTTMKFTIKEVIPNQKFSYYWDSNQMLFTIELISEPNGTRVQFNHEGFDYSLANLNAYLEDRELPYS